MEITIGMLIYLFSLDTTVRTNIDKNADYVVDSLEMWEGGFPKKNIVYLVRQEDVLSDPEIWYRRTVICRGKPSAAFQEIKNTDWICVTDHLSVQEVMQKGLQSIKLGLDWFMELQRELLARKNLTDILDMTEEYLQIGGCVSTREMALKGFSKEFDKRNEWIEEDGGVSMSLVNDLIADADFQKAAELTDAFWFRNIGQEWFCCYNFFAENKYDSRLIASGREQQMSHGILDFVRILGRTIGSVYEQNFYQNNKESSWREIVKTARMLLDGKTVSLGELGDVLSRHQWSAQDCYQIVLFRFQEGASAGVGIKYYQEQIIRLFRECFVVTELNQFVCIRNVTRSDPNHKPKDILPYFLRETLCKAGISNQFYDFSQLLYYFREAEYALTTGERLDSSRWYHRFEKYEFNYIVDRCFAFLTPFQVCHPALQVLEKYDEKNDTSLLKTLDVYLQNRQNITRTAELLQIHRTTLLVRIERIHTLTKLDLENYKTCLHLMMSYEILRKNHKDTKRLL